MKIAICVNSFHPLIGGCEHVTNQLAQYFSKEKLDVYVITRRHKKRKYSDYPFQIIEYLPEDYSGFEQKIRKIQPDYMIIYSDMFDFFRQLITQQSLRTKIVFALCGANWLHQHKNFVYALYRNSSLIHKIVCHSKLDRDYKICENPSLIKKTCVIPNGVDLSEFNSNTISKRELLPEFLEKKWIINISNFFPGKGQTHLISILNQLSNPDEYLYIQIASSIDFVIGEKLEQEWKKQCSTQLNKSIRVLFKKNIPRTETISFLKNSSVFACTSEKEVAPISILESMAASVPWVSANVGNTSELKGGKIINAIKNSRGYAIFDDRVKRLFATAIADLSTSPIIAEDGKLQIEKELNWDMILPRYSELLS